MATPSQSLRALARRLVDLEANSQTGSGPQAHEAVRACETLRVSLTRFAGADGFTSLLRRALVLAAAEVPVLRTVKLTAKGNLEGFEKVEANPSGETVEPAVVITAHLLGLLVAFIGERITLQLVREAWPDAALEEYHSRIEAD